MSDSTRTLVRRFLEPRLPSPEWRDDEDLFARGLIDSLAAMEIVTFVEGTFGVRVPDDELDIRNFRSIEAVAGLADRLAGVTAP